MGHWTDPLVLVASASFAYGITRYIGARNREKAEEAYLAFLVEELRNDDDDGADAD